MTYLTVPLRELPSQNVSFILTFLKCSPVSSKICNTFQISFFVKTQKTLYTITHLSKNIPEHSLKIISDHNSTQCMKNIKLIAIATHRNCYGNFQKVRLFKILEFRPSPCLLVCPCLFSRITQSHPTSHQVRSFWLKLPLSSSIFNFG